MRAGWSGLVFAAVLTVSTAGLLAVSGLGRSAFRPDFLAEIQLQAFPLPSGFGIDPEVVAGYLTEELKQRVDQDVALRLAMGTDGQQRLKDIALPRLMNVVAVRQMIRDVKPLRDTLAVGAFHHVAEIRVSNLGERVGQAVLTLPGAALVEAAAGDDTEVLEVRQTSTGLTAVDLGDLEPGASLTLTAWLDERSAIPPAEFRLQTRLGAAGGRRGEVWLEAHEPWLGEDLQVLAWGRWATIAVLAAAAFAALAGLILPPLLRRRISRA